MSTIKDRIVALCPFCEISLQSAAYTWPRMYGNASQNYRPDIDGLRAVAVSAVVVFHAWPKSLKGGFVGVDAFFVISGFLITRIIIEALERGSFSFTDFYSRRVKRIFPALILVLASCYAVGWVALLPDEFEQLGKHIAAGAGFVSNIVLWRESGYFDAESELKPLLHLWSLGIEEQFYIFWPIIIYIVWRLRLRLHMIIGAVFAVSFVANLALVRSEPVATFYCLFTRAWELLCGAALAYSSMRRVALPGSPNTRAWIGVVLLALSMLFIHKGKAFPGGWALLPTAGAALLISAQGAWFNRSVLSNRAVVGIGLISYPLYLWHWPILSFAHTLWGHEPSNPVKVFAIAVAFGLAWMTFILLERPLRGGRNPNHPSPQRLAVGKVSALCSLMLVVGVTGFVTFRQDGYVSRHPEIAVKASIDSWDAVFESLKTATFDCYPEGIRQTAHKYYDTNIIRCRQTVQEEPIQTIALIGDSHAEHLFWGLSKHLPRNENLVYYTYSCLPFLGLKKDGVDDCERMQLALEHILRQPSIHTVVLANFWADRLEGHETVRLGDFNETDAEAVFVNGLRSTVSALVGSGKTVVFAFDVPTLNFNPANCVRPVSFTVRQCAIPLEKVRSDQHKYRELARGVLSMYPNVKQWDPLEEICGAEQCTVMNEGRFLYLDKNHISRYASEHLGKSLAGTIIVSPHHVKNDVR